MDSAMELFIEGMDNPLMFESINSGSSDEHFDFVLDEHGLPVGARQQANSQVNMSSSHGNNQQN